MIESDDGGLMITGEHVEMWHAARVATGLALEINTTMRLSNRGSVMLAANRITSQYDMAWCGGPATLGRKRTKAGALADLALVLAVMWGYQPVSSVRKALGDDVADKILRKAAKIVKRANELSQ